MKNRKPNGFTLIELLATIVIISILATLTVMAFSSYINSVRDKGEDISIQGIQEASVIYVKENKETLVKNKQNGYCVTVLELIDMGYLKSNVLNDEISEDSYVRVWQDEDSLSYEVSELITDNEKYSKECS